jgi:RNA polymerase sigma-70 factor (ECF subfamily)
MQIPRMHMSAVAGERSNPGLEETFHQHKDMVFRTAYRVTGDAGDAEDVLQTVFLRLVRNSPVTEVRSLPAYLHRAAVNASLDLLRRRKEARTLSLDESKHVEAMSVSVQPATEIREWLRQALARLNPRWAEMFVLRFIEDYGNREIAGMMKTSPAVVAVVLHRTRAQLKKDFKAMTTLRGRP